MDHQRATSIHAAEHYTMGGLSTEDRDEFEEHFFSCAECAEEVRWEQIFAANARATFREEAERARLRQPAVEGKEPWYRALFRPWPVLAPSLAFNLLLAGVVLFQAQSVIPGLRAKLERTAEPQLSYVISVPTVVRGEQKVTTVARGTNQIPLSFAVLKPFSSYLCQVVDEKGGVRLSRALPAPAGEGDELSLSLPAADLSAGMYTVTLSGVEGGSRTEVGHLQIRIQ